MNDTAPSKDASLWERVAWVMERMNRIQKNATNPHFNYKYATADDIAEALRPLFAEAGLAVSMDVVGMKIRKRPTRQGDTQVVTLKVRFGLHAHGCEPHYSTLYCEGEDPSDKACWKAYTGGLKYFLRTHLLLSTGDDNEASGTAGVGERRRNREPQPARQPQAADAAPDIGNASRPSFRPASDKQKKMIGVLMKQKDIDFETREALSQAFAEDMSSRDASAWIDRLQQLPAA